MRARSDGGMRKLALPIAAMILLAAGAVRAETPTPEQGEILVQRHCGGCHATGRSGDSAEPAAPPFRELHRRYEPETLAEALAEGILTGHPAMPEFRFQEDEVRSIILYLDSIQTRRKAER